jgi:hypothetical protein
MLRPSLHSTIAVVVLALTRHATSSNDSPIPGTLSGIAPTIVEIPCKARYRVFRNHALGTNGANLIASANLPQIWTTSGTRVAADSGEWTFERSADGHWSSEFVVGDTIAQPSTSRSPARRYALDYGEQTVIRELFPAEESMLDGGVEPPPVIISDYARMAFPLSTLAIESVGESGTPMSLAEALAEFPVSADTTIEGERTRTMVMHQGLAQLSVTTDERGMILRVEEVAGDEGDGPLFREVTEISETRIVSGHQVPWRYSRTIYDHNRVWERIEFEMIEVTTPAL